MTDIVGQPPLMPSNGHATAPTFNPEQPRTLKRFFRNLEELFDKCEVTTESAKKAKVVYYPPIDTADLWETLPAYVNPLATYNDFKKQIRDLYPGCEDDQKFSIADLDQLIGEHARNGVKSAVNLGNFYRDFIVITTHLIAKQRLLTIQQSEAYIKVFPASPRGSAIRASWDSQSSGDYEGDDEFELDDKNRRPPIHYGRLVEDNATPSPFFGSHSDPAAGIEHLDDCRAVNSSDPGRRTAVLPLLRQYMQAGKVKKNTKGKVVLSTGSFVPQSIPGVTIRDRVYEWHRRNIPVNPALPTSLLMFEISSAPTMATYSLNTTDRIAALEKELFQLRKRNEVFNGIELPASKKPIQGVPKILVREPDETASRVAPAAPVTHAAAPSSSTQSTSPSPPSLQPVASTEHPFAAARDTTYTPPNLQNFGAAPKANPNKGKDPSYRTLTPVYRPEMIEKVFE
ncbi:uncharacterized protein FIBRA_09583 [Fibroporia radiculosa]|uniref:Uncharacterized protein n=1 Tax=Fibroporia radiculosa TaxID=599839 RepID=J7SD71_9APHY|nr:uncharacterized protein FIBRA_09583 [Fibroporia radiculosa]CCM07238.1 predicted protein [Fibroporia radiculosa]